MEIYRVNGDSPKWLFKAYDFIRMDAFVFGQNIPLEMEFSHDDPDEELDAVLIFDDHKPVAGCRITYPEKGIGKIGRVCVIRERQRSGIGMALIAEAEKWIAESGTKHIVINSQDRAVQFYEKCGYVLNPDVNPEIYEKHHIAQEDTELAGQKYDLGFSCALVEKYMQ